MRHETLRLNLKKPVVTICLLDYLHDSDLRIESTS